MTDTKTFLFRAKAEATGSISNRVNKSTLGDGYSVSSPDGINTETQSWSVTVISPLVKCKDGKGDSLLALEFLREHGASARSFYWVTPLGDTIRVEASAITPKKTGSVMSVSTNFTQVYR